MPLAPSLKVWVLEVGCKEPIYMRIIPRYDMQDCAVRGQRIIYAIWKDLSDGVGIGYYIVSHKAFDGSKEIMYISHSRVHRCHYKVLRGDSEPWKFQKHKINFIPKEPAEYLDKESKRVKLYDFRRCTT